MADVVLRGLLLVAVSGCSAMGPNDDFRASGRLDARVWALREMDSRPVPTTRPEAATIRLASDHTVRGSSACNHVGGEEIRWARDPQVREGTFRRHAAGATIITAMGCADEARMILGDRFWERMVHAATWSIEKNSLTIRFDDGSSALLKPVSAPRR